MISLTGAAAARVAEAGFAFLLYRKPMARLIGGPSADPVGSVYLESAILTCLAVAPALFLMIWSNWSPSTSVWLVSGAVALGGLLWGGALIVKQHPIYLEARRFLPAR